MHPEGACTWYGQMLGICTAYQAAHVLVFQAVPLFASQLKLTVPNVLAFKGGRPSFTCAGCGSMQCDQNPQGGLTTV